MLEDLAHAALLDPRIDLLGMVRILPTQKDAASNLGRLKSLIDLAHSLDMGVTAEGGETSDTWRHLTDLSCDLIQGYYVSHPLAPDQIDHFLFDQVHDSPCQNSVDGT